MRRAAAVRAAVQPAKALTVHTVAVAVHAILVDVPVLLIAAVLIAPVQQGIITPALIVAVQGIALLVPAAAAAEAVTVLIPAELVLVVQVVRFKRGLVRLAAVAAVGLPQKLVPAVLVIRLQNSVLLLVRQTLLFHTAVGHWLVGQHIAEQIQYVPVMVVLLQLKQKLNHVRGV